MHPTPRVIFIGQARAEQMRPPRASALVSITDPGRAVAVLRAGWDDVLRLSFHDHDPVDFPREEEDLVAITDQQALNVARFVRTSAARARLIAVHCRYGVSRSAGVAKAVAEHLGVPFPSDYTEHNAFVYRAVRWALQAEA